MPKIVAHSPAKPKLHASHSSPPPKTTAKKKVATSGSDAYVKVSKSADALDIGSIREARGLAPSDAGTASDGIHSKLPIDALGEIKTHGRSATGFRLDGGSVRNMWVSARRIVEGGKKGYELFFFAHGDAVQLFKDRLETLKAKKGTYEFVAAKVSDDDPEGKSALHRGTETWSPSSSSNTMVLSEEGKWKVEYNAGDPEALKGAMRIRVYGTDATASKALQDVVKKIGLQKILAPSTPDSVEKLKIARFMWQNARDALKPLTVKSFDEVDPAAIEDALDAAADVKAVKKADLKDEGIKKRVNLAALFLEKDPAAFIEWASSNYYGEHGILPSSNYDYSDIESPMETAGIKPGNAAFKKASSKSSAAPDREDANKVLLFGLLAKTDKAAAHALLAKDAGSISSDDLKELAIGEGFSAARLKQLRYEEVYPGYFTVVDPAQVEQLHKAGARYLYSTFDDADRVMSLLTGGQKASLTRFGEGLLVQGKSTSSDFGTGGATAVFTRLVTKSAVEKGVKSTKGSSGGYSYSYDGKFNDWGGSRPYKVIINKAILARTDWWGFNGDNFGKSTGLKPENFGESLVKTIDNSYSSSNELMFPVGNDPA